MSDLSTQPAWLTKIQENINHYNHVIKNSPDKYPMLNRAASPMDAPSTDIVGRDMTELRSALQNPAKPNVILLGDAGSGKTAFIQGFAYSEESINYLILSINIERLIEEDDLDTASGLSNGLTDLFNEIETYTHEENIITVVFIDEFHRIMMLSPSAIEALKPTLERSARAGFRIVAATTFEEYDQYISGNRALDQRFIRITLQELGRKSVIQILKNTVAQLGLEDQTDPTIFEEIYHQSKHILISNSQPRASVDMLNAMIGDTVKDQKMVDGKLVRTFATPQELGLSFDKIISRPLLHRHIRRAYGIDIDNRIQVKKVRQILEENIYNQDQAVQSVMRLLERMLVGFSDPSRPKISFLSTGPTGVGKALDDNEQIPMIRNHQFLVGYHGNLRVGDKVFNRQGKPVDIIGVYPQGHKTIYLVTLEDGRQIRCADDHLWTVVPYSKETTGVPFESHAKETITTKTLQERIRIKSYALPSNQALTLPDKHYKDDLTKVGRKLADLSKNNDPTGIPLEYLSGSIPQRQKLLDAILEGARKDAKGYYYETPSYYFNKDLKQLCYSLGIQCRSQEISESMPSIIYRLFIPTNQDQLVKIQSIKILNKKVPMTCIMVDDDEHLYQTLNGLVTHNTELAKQASDALGIPLKRFDMSRYSRPEDAIRFANELAAAAWSAPNAYILIDEAEKSTKEAMNILLQVLDDARLTAANNPSRVISFTGNIINLTTNLGSSTYQHMKRFGEADKEVDVEVIYRSLADSAEFETAVLGRLDAIVPFIGLPDDAMIKIAHRELDRQIPLVETDKRQFFLSHDIIPYVVLDRTSSNTERGGARDIKRNINDIVLGSISTYLANEPEEVPVIVLLEGRPRFKNPDVGDPQSAHIRLVECHPHSVVDSWVTAISSKLNTIFYNNGLFIPKAWTINDFAKDVVLLSQHGVRHLQTEVDGSRVSIIDGLGYYKGSKR